MVGRPRAFDPDDVLDRAMCLFWARGYEATGIAELTEHLGIGRQSLYATFGSKHQLYLRAVEHYATRQLAGMVTALDTADDPLGAVRDVLAAWQEHASRPATPGCLLANAAAELGLRDPELAQVVGTKLRWLERALRRALERAREQGALPADRDPRAIARTLVAAGQGLAVMTRVQPGSALARDVIGSLQTLLE